MPTYYKIRKPVYGAGTTHKWDATKHGIMGVGIAKKRLRGKTEFRVEVDGVRYILDVATARRFVEEHEYTHTTFSAGAGSVDAVVIPLSLLTPQGATNNAGF